MKFSLSVIALAATSFMRAAAVPTEAAIQTDVAVEQRDVLSGLTSQQKQLPAARALAIVNNLNHKLEQYSLSINKTTHSINSKSSQNEKNAAVKHVGGQMQAMTIAITEAIGTIGQEANGVHLEGRQMGGKGSAQALAQALRTTLVTAAGTVNTALAVLGLTPLLAFLTPLTGSLSGLVLTLRAVVDQLLPFLNIVLDGVVIGLSGLLAGLIL